MDSVNNLKRTCLHIACDKNQINSHQEIINLLVNTFGVNVTLSDRHNKNSMELLVGPKTHGFQNIPTASLQREEIIIERRDSIFQEISDKVR